MLLKNQLQHMAGKAVLVDGEKFEIDADGFADVSDNAAKKLLASKFWAKGKRRKPVAAEKPEEKPEEISEEKPEENAKEELDIASMSKAELVVMCEANDVEFPSNATKKDLVNLLVAKAKEGA